MRNAPTPAKMAPIAPPMVPKDLNPKSQATIAAAITNVKWSMVKIVGRISCPSNKRRETTSVQQLAAQPHSLQDDSNSSATKVPDRRFVAPPRRLLLFRPLRTTGLRGAGLVPTTPEQQAKHSFDKL